MTDLFLQQFPTAMWFSVDAATGRVAAVGNGSAPWGKGDGGATDLMGAVVVPGMIDAHLHVIMGGRSLSALDLGPAQSLGDLARQLQAYREGSVHSESDWLVGFGWDEMRWGGGLPGRELLDSSVAVSPVVLYRVDGHLAACNSLALELAGITAETRDPPGGHIVRDAAGNPTGILKDGAIQLVRRLIARPSVQERRAAVQRASLYALERGVTFVVDMGEPALNIDDTAAWDDLNEVFLPMADAGELPIRVHTHVPLALWRHLDFLIDDRGKEHDGGRLSWGSLKEFADGSLGSHTALMHEPYADKADTSGLRNADTDHMRRAVAEANSRGMQVSVHAIGDRAVDEVQEIFRAVAAASPSKQECRHRIEHVQHIAGTTTAEALASTGTYAVVNPLHLLEDAAMLDKRLGPTRSGAGRSFALGTLLEAEVPIAFGSDWPFVGHVDPLGTIRAAAERIPNGGSVPFVPEERISRKAALEATMWGGAFVGFREHDLGRLARGFRGDFAVLDSSPLESSHRTPRVLATYVDGVCAFPPVSSRAGSSAA